MNPTALFAAQYAEAIKLRREVDPIIGLYEKLGISYRANDFAAFNETVAQLHELATERTGEAASTLHFEKNLQWLRAVLSQFPCLTRSSLSSPVPLGLRPLTRTRSAKATALRKCFATPLSSSPGSFCYHTLSVFSAECILKADLRSQTYTPPPCS